MSRAIRHGNTVAAIVAIAVAGCGGSSQKATPSEQQQQQVEQVLRSYLRAQTSGDGQTACSLLTDAAQRQLETLVLQAGNGLLTTRPSCQDAVGLVRAVAGAKLLNALSKAQIAQVRVQGNDATAEIIDGAAFGQQQVSLQRSGSTWQIAGVPALTGRAAALASAAEAKWRPDPRGTACALPRKRARRSSRITRPSRPSSTDVALLLPRDAGARARPTGAVEFEQDDHSGGSPATTLLPRRKKQQPPQFRAS